MQSDLGVNGFQMWLVRIRSRQVRPGIALSALLHIGLLSWLAVMLAFHRPDKAADEPEVAIIMATPQLPPPPPPPPQKVQTPLFKPTLMPAIRGVETTVPPLVIPPVVEIVRPTKTEIVTEEHIVVVQPRVLSRINPEYPDRALENNISGYVDIEGTVAPDGSFTDGKVITEAPQNYGFAKALFKVIPRWKFEPKTINGAAVPYRISYRFSFALK